MTSLFDTIPFEGFLTLPDKSKIKVFEQKETGELVLTKQFIELWYDLFQLGESINTGGAIITNFTLPPQPVSKLIGTSFLSDPDSVVQVVSFDLLTNNGPILNAGFNLRTFSNALFYKIQWLVKSKTNSNKSDKSKDPVRIGFYTSDDFQFGVTNNLFLICGSKGASLFEKPTGSFVCVGINLIYVAISATANQDVQVLLKVTPIEPDVLIYPTATLEMPYIKSITIQSKERSNCNTFILPVYTIRVNSPDESTLIKTPSGLFRQVAALIRSFLDETSLSILLWEDLPPMQNSINNRRNNKQIPSVLQQSQTRVYNDLAVFATTKSRYLFSDTTNLPEEERAIQYSGNRFVGFSPGREATSGTGLMTTYIITIRNVLSIPITPIVEALKPDNSLLFAFCNRLDPETGRINGKCSTVFPTIPSTQTQQLVGSFLMEPSFFTIGVLFLEVGNSTAVMPEIGRVSRYNEITISIVRFN